MRQLLFFVAGLLLLYGGAEGLVRGAAALARTLGISALAVGLTVVAFGTSAPELVVSLLAGARGQGDVALGNVVGSNIANIALILGLSALIAPLRVEFRLIAREIPFMIAVSAVAGALLLDGRLGRLEAGALLAGFLGYLTFVLRAAGRGAEAPEGEYRGAEAMEAEYREFEETALSTGRWTRTWRQVGLVAGGLGGLAVGAHLLVTSSVHFARLLGVPELVIGLTLVAVGTSLPELATSAVAAFQRKADIAVGNIVGSNIFNLLAILGVSGLVRPLASSAALVRLELPAMLFLALLLLPLAWSRFQIQRWEGALLLGGYGAFLLALFLRGS